MRSVLVVFVAIIVVACASTSPLPSNEEAVPEAYRSLPRSSDPDIEAPKVIERVHPIVPASFRRGRNAATAQVEAVVDEEGRVKAVWYSSGDAEWAGLVADAVRQWKFEPAKRNGVPLAVRFTVTSKFRN